MTKPVLLCAFLLSAAVLRAQPGGAEPAATPEASAAATPPPPCAVRAWFFPGTEQASVALRMRRPNVEEPVMLGKTTGGARSAPAFYDERPAGNALFELIGNADVSNIVAAFDERCFFNHFGDAHIRLRSKFGGDFLNIFFRFQTLRNFIGKFGGDSVTTAVS